MCGTGGFSCSLESGVCLVAKTSGEMGIWSGELGIAVFGVEVGSMN